MNTNDGNPGQQVIILANARNVQNSNDRQVVHQTTSYNSHSALTSTTSSPLSHTTTLSHITSFTSQSVPQEATDVSSAPVMPNTNPSTSATARQSFVWNLFCRRALIDLCIQLDVRHFTKRKWKQVGDQLSERIGAAVNAQQCKRQWFAEVQEYRDSLDPPLGSACPKPHLFFDELQAYIGDDPTILYPTSQWISSISPSSGHMGQTSFSQPLHLKRLRRVTQKSNVISRLKECQEHSMSTAQLFLSKFEELKNNQTCLLERILLIEEQRVENETKFIALEEEKVKNDRLMVNLLNRFTDRT